MNKTKFSNVVDEFNRLRAEKEGIAEAIKEKRFKKFVDGIDDKNDIVQSKDFYQHNNYTDKINVDVLADLLSLEQDLSLLSKETKIHKGVLLDYQSKKRKKILNSNADKLYKKYGEQILNKGESWDR